MELENWAYRVRMQGGGDFWGLFGRRFGRPSIPEGSEGWISTPIEFNEEEMTVKTFSGSVYKLGVCDGNLEQQKQYIRDDIEEYKLFLQKSIEG